MSDDRLAGLMPATRDLIEKIESGIPSQATPEFTRLSEKMLSIQVCTSLSDEDATARANLMPSGTSFGWVLSDRPEVAPVPCNDQPETHRHLIFEC